MSCPPHQAAQEEEEGPHHRQGRVVWARGWEWRRVHAPTPAWHQIHWWWAHGWWRPPSSPNGATRQGRRAYEDLYNESQQERIAEIQLDDQLASEFKDALIPPDPPQRRMGMLSGDTYPNVGAYSYNSPGGAGGGGNGYYSTASRGSTQEQQAAQAAQAAARYDDEDEYVSVLFADDGDDDEDYESETSDGDDGDVTRVGGGGGPAVAPFDGDLSSLEDTGDALIDITGISLVSESLAEFIEEGESLPTEPSAHTFTRVVASAVTDGFVPTLIGNLENFGVEVVENFGDFEPAASDTYWTAEEIAAFKARAVYEATGLPTIAESTTFEVAPVNGGIGRKNARYRFNRIGPFVDKLAQFLEPVSDPNRMTCFRTVLCYYDGVGETFESADAEVALCFADSTKSLITLTNAMMHMLETLTGFWEDAEFMPQGMRPPRPPADKAAALADAKGPIFSGASMLREHILKHARVLPNNILDVSAFMESFVDMALMEECAKELAHRFAQLRPTKILTVATTGLVIAAPMAVLLQVPLVYARKQRTMVMSDYHIATYASRTQSVNKELVVSKGHLSQDDRVLIVDDFLSAGSCQDALLRIISDAGAKPVGIAVLVEKAYEKGRMFLSGYNIPIESLATVTSASEGRIILEEEAA